ncbi:uncharacterized protein LOC112088021 [Eutrema salsugineum]|uniref:uncharacterized protein LOC112088021 n=1 Tax=Eutrema salsugineum TaxID=72664 RepID=UPI000CECFB9C|nr:uncharacterized protein LOC112088021 [Eutrema salsugineum]
MNKPLFMHIVWKLSNKVPYFGQKKDALGRCSLSALQKCTAAIRLLAYDTAADTEASTVCIRSGRIALPPGKGNIHEDRENPQSFLEAVASYDLWIWHAFFGPPGTLNDINVLDRSPVFDDIIQGRAPKVNFSVNGTEYNLAYYLTDGIYPKWTAFVQSIPLPQGEKARAFARHQESVRKDVERVFGVLQARFAIVKNPALFWDKAKIGKIMRDCIILHNMIVQDERDRYSLLDVSDFEQGEGSGGGNVNNTFQTNMPSRVTNMMAARLRVRDSQIHHQLKFDLVEHIWQQFGEN